jgi:hypothetical protein
LRHALVIAMIRDIGRRQHRQGRNEMLARFRGVAALALTLAPLVAAAQTTEDALLENDPAANSGLVEAEPAEKVDTSDPDPKLLKAIDTRRGEFEKRLNALQSAQPRFTKTDGPIEKLVSDFVNAQDAFLTKQSELKSKYVEANATADEKAKKKLEADLAKIRKSFQGELDKLGKRADKLQAERDKLMKAYLKEQGEDAEKPAEAAAAEAEGSAD